MCENECFLTSDLTYRVWFDLQGLRVVRDNHDSGSVAAAVCSAVQCRSYQFRSMYINQVDSQKPHVLQAKLNEDFAINDNFVPGNLLIYPP